MAYQLITYKKATDIPPLPGKNLFHSVELFRVFEQTSGYKPLMIVTYENSVPKACLLAAVRKSVRWFPPSIIKRCEIYGSGEYFTDQHQEEIFGEMLQYLTRIVLNHCFLIEFRNLDNALFAYKYFRENKYFPINWLRIHNSLHSKTPEQRLSSSRKRQIKRALNNGATMHIAETEEDIRTFAKMLKKNYSSKIRKHFPGINFFLLLVQQNTTKEIGKIFIIKFKEKIIGGSVCLFSNQNAYLWFSGGLRKSYPLQYPGILAVWKALLYAYDHGYQHMEYMDVGLPFKQHGYRDFILRFGGAQYSTRRWFRFRWNWLNRLLTIFYI